MGIRNEWHSVTFKGSQQQNRKRKNAKQTVCPGDGILTFPTGESTKQKGRAWQKSMLDEAGKEGKAMQWEGIENASA